jgi:hypothetical protein
VLHRIIDFPGTVRYEPESNAVRFSIRLHMEYLHVLYYCQHCLKSWYKLKDWEKVESLLFIGHVIQPKGGLP